AGKETRNAYQLNEYNIKPHIREPTTFDRGGAATCIDNSFSNMEVLSACVGDTYLSDHTFQVCKFDIKRRNYSPNNIKLFENCLITETWDSLKSKTNFNEKFKICSGIFYTYYNECFPEQLVKENVVSKNGLHIGSGSLHLQLCEMSKMEKCINNPIYTDKFKKIKEKIQRRSGLR
ncbi:hypothetical protein HHI36_018774, partial [Cryptolaemus montrouzieri]